MKKIGVALVTGGSHGIGAEYARRLDGIDVTSLPSGTVMSARALVDAALAELDQGELVTMPFLQDLRDWDRFEEARKAVVAAGSRERAAPRYQPTDPGIPVAPPRARV